jgi:predicted nuclease of predicted toxin-antitoxin system
MKLLLDENLPKKLKIDLGPDHEVFTVRDLRRNGKKNGELLGLMTLNGFDGLVTIDKNLIYQQNINRFPLSIFVLNANNNKLETLKPFIASLLSILQSDFEQGIIQVT